MSYSFPRGGDASPPAGYSSDDSSPRGTSPSWRSSKGRNVQGYNAVKVVKVIAVCLGVFIVISLASSVFTNSGPKEEFLAEGIINKNHFVDYEGGLDCRLSSTELYTPPLHNTPQAKKAFPYCKNRAQLLEALSGGGRHGFDTPYTPKGCHFKWYTTKEVCMILDRFDGVVFVGDDLVHRIYAAFNVILRQDLALGSLTQWKMSDKERDNCRCSHQYTRPECSRYFVNSNDEVAASDAEGTYRAPYACNRIPHFYLPITGSPAPEDLTDRFADLLNSDPHSWKPVAIVHSLGLSTGFQWMQATDSMDEWLTIADNSGRNSPFLWLGPNAAGHLKPPTKIMQEGNNALWHYSIEMAREAGRRGVESLSLYNTTLQAVSWDGSSYGERVSLTHAMMIINWLALLETT